MGGSVPGLMVLGFIGKQAEQAMESTIAYTSAPASSFLDYLSPCPDFL